MAYRICDCDTPEHKGVSGTQYTELMDFCFKHSRYFALTFLHIRSGVDMLEELSPYLHTSYASKEELWYPYGQDATVNIYVCTEESKAIFPRQTDALFSWEAYTHHRAEDIAFFREDGMAVFDMVTHEGIATIYDLVDEEVPVFVQQEPWERIEDDPRYIPAIWTAKYIADLPVPKKQRQKLNIIEKINISKRKNPYRRLHTK